MGQHWTGPAILASPHMSRAPAPWASGWPLLDLVQYTQSFWYMGAQNWMQYFKYSPTNVTKRGMKPFVSAGVFTPKCSWLYLSNRITRTFVGKDFLFTFAKFHEVFSAYFSSLLRSLHTAALLSSVSIAPSNSVSSINSQKVYDIHSIPSFRSLINIWNYIGLSRGPWGTPWVTGC